MSLAKCSQKQSCRFHISNWRIISFAQLPIIQDLLAILIMQLKLQDFDKNNNEASIEFLKNSLEISLKKRLDLLKEPNGSFACVWLRLIQLRSLWLY